VGTDPRVADHDVPHRDRVDRGYVAAVVVYHQTIWDPVALTTKFSSTAVVVIGLIMVVLATMSVNVAANVVSPSYDFSNASPRAASFRRFLAEGRHAFLIRRPEEIAAFYYALYPDMSINAIGLKALHELHAAVRDAGGNRPVVIDSDDLQARPEATMAAYCAAVGLPFIPQALAWEPGERSEWRQTGPIETDKERHNNNFNNR
jgi:hypothetical protein